jgi:heterodisulfide reductase subunit A-like polyferredoxin
MKKPKFIPEFADIPTGRTKMPELTGEERRLNFKEVELGFTEEMARQEAARCLSCRRCIGCGLCLAECDQCAIVYDDQDRTVAIEADAIVFTSDAELFNAGRKRDLGYGEAWNVITSFEFERLASPTGPFGGLILRPSDGEIPKRIAFIQCVGSRDEGIGANYCSVECCSRTLSQAWRARESAGAAGDIGVWVFHKGLRPYGKTSEVESARLAGEKWARFVDATVASVREDPAAGTLTVHYASDGKDGTETFDLVVLAIGVEAKRDFRRHARLGGVAVNKYGFIDPGVASAVACKEGVAFAGPVRGPQAAARSVIDAIAAASKVLASPALATPPASASSSRSTASPPIIFACEYGLDLAGVGACKPLLDEAKARGLDVRGAYPLLCYKDGRQAMKHELGAGSRLMVLGCHSGSHEGLFERALDLPRGTVTILGRAERGSGIEAALALLVSGKAGGRPEQPPRHEPPARPPAVSHSPAGARTVAVLGGGVSGLAAASELLKRGLKVVVIEKSEVLGANLAKATITGEPADVKVVENFVTAVEANPNARVVRSATLTRTARAGDALELVVNTPDGNLTVEAGALVIATGASAFDPAELGLGKHPATMTQADFRAGLTRGDAPWQKIIMVQCVGARDAEHPYCSRYCCREALLNALAFKHLNPQAELTILHRGIRAFGFDEEIYSEAGERGVAFIEIEGRPMVAPQTSPSGRGQEIVKVTGTSRTGTPFCLACDAVVLSVAHNHGDVDRIASLAGAPLDGLGFLETANQLIQPFASPAAGIFVCGFARNPVTVEEAFVEGLGVAGAVCQYMG